MSPIRHLFRSRSRISERIVGEPIEIRERTIRPVVQLSGWRSTGGDMLAGGTGVKLRTRPAGVIVLERDGREHRLPTPDNTRIILWALAGFAVIVAVASEVVVRVLR
jgi:hypothetical protein